VALSEFLREFGEDLVERAKRGKLDDALCRDDEINRVIEILARRKKNNVLLLGDPGVGKTSIIEGIAKRIAAGETNKILDKKIIYSLDYHYLISGTMYRGQLEERATNLIREIRSNKNIILFIDEIHSIFSNKIGSSSSSDLNNFLKPYLSSGEVQIIGITTYDEYRTSIGKDKALARRFQNIVIGQTTAEQTLNILKSTYQVYEKYHNVKYEDDVLEECVKLAKRYIFDRQMPDSAIDILDEAGSIVSLYNNKFVPDSRKIRNLKSKLSRLDKEKKRRIKSDEFENILELKKELDGVKYELETEKDKWYIKNSDKIPTVKIEDLHLTVSKMTGIDPDHFGLSYLSRVDNLKNNFKDNVFGQDHAIEDVIKILRRKVIDINDNEKPLASFLMAGPSGVGKTTFAKLISQSVFGSEKNMIRIDMSEYKDSTSTNKLIGSSPGYVGYEEGGILTEEVKKHPHSVILFDEAEKAHKDVFNLLLQILDEGHIKDSSGSLVNFKHCIIILTSNLGTDVPESVGFKTDNKSGYESAIHKEIQKFFRVEFLNRLDKIICFKHLQISDITNIYDYELTKIKTKLQKHNINIKISAKLKTKVIENGYNDNYGARFLKRTMHEMIVDNVLDCMINGKCDNRESMLDVELDWKRNKVAIKIID
jgi:ATP-dependent Clp protease ATP-binding subunit ClpC